MQPSPTRTLFSFNRGSLSAIAVCIPLYNYASIIIETLNSVHQQTISSLDLVIVDDASTDNGSDLVIGWLQEHSSRFNSCLFLQHLNNAGLSATRNTACYYAQTEFVFLLDADNFIYPQCLERLYTGLSKSERGFAYPIIEHFGDSQGLFGIEPWSPELLAFGNYIDAMALIRLSIVKQLNGWRKMQFGIWEDYEFWCRCVEQGISGIQVPEILARYRVHISSMSFKFACSMQDSWQEMKALHGWLQPPALTEAATTTQVDTNPPSMGRGIYKNLSKLKNVPNLLQRIQQSKLFARDYYVKRYPDIQCNKIKPHIHYIKYGAWEMRIPHPFFELSASNPLQVTEEIISLNKVKPAPKEPFHQSLLERIVSMVKMAKEKHLTEIAICFPKRSEHYHYLLQEQLITAFASIGIRVIQADETIDPKCLPSVKFVASPHNFFDNCHQNWLTNRTLSKLVLIQTIKPDAPQFHRAVYFSMRCGAVLDTNPLSTLVLNELGIPAQLLLPGYVENFRLFEAFLPVPNIADIMAIPAEVKEVNISLDAPLRERPLDVCLIATDSQRRRKMLATLAPTLSKFKCGIFFQRREKPSLLLAPDLVAALVRRSKILIHIHNTDLPYLPWYRMLTIGILQKTLLIIEPGQPIPELTPSIDYVVCPVNQMAEKIEWYLNNLEGQQEAERISSSGFASAKRLYDLPVWCKAWAKKYEI